MQEYLLIFDIETIPDNEAAKNLTGLETEDVFEQREALTDYHLEITEGKNAFLRQPFHKVVAISYGLVKIDIYDKLETYSLKMLRSGGNAKSSEAELIKGFFAAIEKYKPRLVSFNGRTFDIPVLKYRAMKYGIAATSFYTLGDKWSNYNHRYSLDWHCDLIDALSDFGASARIKLHEACSIFNFPGKFGVDGAEVTTLFDDGNVEAIRDYCETDVLNTYLVYLRYMLHLGKLSITNYNFAIEDIIKYINENPNKIHLQEFKAAWEAASVNNQLTL
ncbi:3'-5' exonuclease [Rickettsiales bacterium LUAb2]